MSKRDYYDVLGVPKGSEKEAIKKAYRTKAKELHPDRNSDNPNAEADKERRELIEAKNQAESLIHSTEKSMEEHSDKVDPTTIEAIELAISALKEELETEEAGKIKSGIQNVTEAAMKLGEAIYKASQEDGENSDKEPGSADFDDNIVDADFEDLDDEQRS